MKKMVSLAAALLLLVLLPSCGGETSVWQETPVAPQTNESLSVFCIGDLKDSDMIELALSIYQEMYPDVEVELIKPEYDAGDYEMREELYQQAAVRIMAGEGPDVFIIDDTIMDVEKLVRQGAFADMEPYFQADNFDWSPYNQAVIDGGVWNGKRFVIPLSYDLPLLFTSKAALEETGFDVDACGDYLGFLEETARYMEDSAQKRELFNNPLFVTNVVKLSGLAVADYDTRTIDLSSPVFRQGMGWYKTVMESHANGTAFDVMTLSGAAAVRDGEVLWASPVLGALDGFYCDFGALKTLGDAVMMPIRDLDGGIQAEIEIPVAVRANSENLQNAYDLLKILLSEEVQCAYSSEQLSVLDLANEYFYQENTQGRLLIVQEGTQGFTSTENPLLAVDWATPEEFEEFMGYTREITGTCYSDHLGPNRAMYPYVFEGADYDETLAEAQRQLERYITE